MTNRTRAHTGRELMEFTRNEWMHLSVLYGFIALLHGVGWGLFLYYSNRYPTMVGLGFVAYLFGLRHAFDADHIAAVDDTVRYMVQQGRRSLDVGFFFSLGHATVVIALSLAISFLADPIKHAFPEMRSLGGIIGASVSGLFLWVIGLLNLVVLIDLLGVWQHARAGQHTHARLDEMLARRGLISRLFRNRSRRFIGQSWQMYPLGILFGLGFDTASEIGLLAMAAGASAGNLPVPAVLSLPILFAAGMSLMDTTDGALMSKVYDWALLNPLRKIIYNLATTGVTVAMALAIGTIELLQVLGTTLGLDGPFFRFLRNFDFGLLGYVIVGMFLAIWAIAFVMCRNDLLGNDSPNASLTVAAQAETP